MKCTPSPASAAPVSSRTTRPRSTDSGVNHSVNGPWGGRAIAEPTVYPLANAPTITVDSASAHSVKPPSSPVSTRVPLSSITSAPLMVPPATSRTTPCTAMPRTRNKKSSPSRTCPSCSATHGWFGVS